MPPKSLLLLAALALSGCGPLAKASCTAATIYAEDACPIIVTFADGHKETYARADMIAGARIVTAAKASTGGK